MGFFKDSYGDFHDFWTVIFIISIMVLIVGVMIIGVNEIERKKCREASKTMGLDYSYSFWEDCQVKMIDGNFIPLDNYNSFVDNTNIEPRCYEYVNDRGCRDVDSNTRECWNVPRKVSVDCDANHAKGETK